MFKTSLFKPVKLANESERSRAAARRRQLWTVLFAIALVTISSVASAQSPEPEALPAPSQIAPLKVYYGEATSLPVADSNAVVDANRIRGGATTRVKGDRRPAYVELVAKLSNFDADADPDGWRAEIVLRDRKDRPAKMRAHATFELMPRVPMADHANMVNAAASPVRWTQQLHFDDDGVARVKLKLRQSLRPMLGWSSSLYPPSHSPQNFHGSKVRGVRPSRRDRTFVTLNVERLVGMPSTAELRVRVSVPTAGVFEAVTPVRVRPSVLVDTHWPYR